MTAGAPPPVVSVASLRFGALRFWLAAMGLIAFAVMYVNPLVFALRQPAPVEPLTPLALHAVTFPRLVVPALQPIPEPTRLSAAKPARTAERAAKPAPAAAAQKRSAKAATAAPVAPAVPAQAPSTAPAETRTVPVQTNEYVVPGAATSGSAPADPFANEPTVDSTVGTVPPPAEPTEPTATAPPKPAPAPAADPAPSSPSAGQAADATPPGPRALVMTSASDASAEGAATETVATEATATETASASTETASTQAASTEAATESAATESAATETATTEAAATETAATEAASTEAAASEMETDGASSEGVAGADDTPAADTSPATETASESAPAESASASQPAAAQEEPQQQAQAAPQQEQEQELAAQGSQAAATEEEPQTQQTEQTQTGQTESTQQAAAPQSGSDAAPAGEQDAAAAPSQWKVVLGSGGDDVSITASGSDLVVTVNGESFSRPAAEVSDIAIVGGDGSDTLTVGVVSVAIAFDGGAGSDTVAGSTAHSTWNVTGAGSGSVANVAFANAEHLVGAADNDDLFVLEPGGSIESVDGGAGGYDSLKVTADTVVSNPIDVHSGRLTIDGVGHYYDGLEPVDLTANNVIINGTDISLPPPAPTGIFVPEQLRVTPDPDHAGHIKVAIVDPFDIGIPLAEYFHFQISGTANVTINGGEGGDTVVFAGDYLVPNSNLTVNAETIKINEGVTINVGTGNIAFNATAKGNGTSLVGITSTLLGVGGAIDIGVDDDENGTIAPISITANNIDLKAFAGTLATTVNGAGQNLAGGTLNVASTNSFGATGKFTVVGGTGTCEYTG